MSLFEVTLDRPPVNALNLDMFRWILDQLEQAQDRPILLTGAGSAFSAGVDLKEILEMDPGSLREFLVALDEVVQRLYQYPAPTAVAVNGHAIAGGCILALVCDYRVMVTHERARMGLTEASIGVMFPPVTLEIIQRCIPGPSLQRVVLGAGLHSPQEALDLGLVDALDGEPLVRAREGIEQLSGFPAEAYASTKQRLRELAVQDNSRAIDEALDAWTSEETRTRMSSLLK